MIGSWKVIVQYMPIMGELFDVECLWGKWMLESYLTSTCHLPLEVVLGLPVLEFLIVGDSCGPVYRIF